LSVPDHSVAQDPPAVTPVPSPQPAREPTGGYRPVTPWSPLWALGATALIMGVVYLFLAIALIVIVMRTSDVSAVAAGATLRLEFGKPVVAYTFGAMMLLSQLLGIGLTFAFARRYGARALDVLALNRPVGGGSAYLWAVPAFVVFGFGVGALVQWLSPQSSQADTQIMVELTRSPAWWMILIAAVVLAPLQEELLFRGFLFSALARSRTLQFAGATLITSVCWAAIHGYSPQGNATIFALGLALSFVLWRTGSTRVTMLCHGTYNALAFAAASFVPPPGV